ncbi:hypothetical protein JKP88DRAFT_346513 [Tribonema minus]|uniref:Non-structural maintenance of chromosomes element 4 n=1 Tax=Tribonema minus TaxID=303371 RepID=A0A835Z541_9STRA|nr:hypothetical protein JKP88DRAFT_346513 [Tribonema minus]
MQIKGQRHTVVQELEAHRVELIADRPQIARLESVAFEKAIDKSEMIFGNIYFPNAMHKDVVNLKIISTASTRQVGNLMAKGLPFGHTEFLASLAQRATPRNGEVDWAQLGHAVSACVRCVPRMDFMLGPLDRHEVVRAVRRQRKQKPNDDFESVAPLRVKKGGKEQKDPEHIRKAAMKDRFLEPGCSQEFAKFIMNSSSFTETVENMFDFTDFIKHGLTGLSVDTEAGTLNAQFTRILTQDDAAAARSKNKQAVLSFTKQDFVDLIELCGLEGQEPTIPDRRTVDGSDYYDPLVVMENRGGGGGGAHDGE